MKRTFDAANAKKLLIHKYRIWMITCDSNLILTSSFSCFINIIYIGNFYLNDTLIQKVLHSVIRIIELPIIKSSNNSSCFCIPLEPLLILSPKKNPWYLEALLIEHSFTQILFSRSIDQYLLINRIYKSISKIRRKSELPLLIINLSRQ